MSGPDLVGRLREGFQGDHDRGCEGRQYTCSCGYDARFHLAAEEAAAELSTLRSRCETLEREKGAAIASCRVAEADAELWQIQVDMANAARDEAVRALEWYADLPREWTVNAQGLTYGTLHLLGEKARDVLASLRPGKEKGDG